MMFMSSGDSQSSVVNSFVPVATKKKNQKKSAFCVGNFFCECIVKKMLIKYAFSFWCYRPEWVKVDKA